MWPASLACMGDVILAHRSREAAQIILDAFGITRYGKRRQVVRYELLGADVAIAIVRDGEGPTLVKAARRLPDGRAMQLRKACRRGFESVKDQLAYFDMMYRQYGPMDPRTAAS